MGRRVPSSDGPVRNRNSRHGRDPSLPDGAGTPRYRPVFSSPSRGLSLPPRTPVRRLSFINGERPTPSRRKDYRPQDPTPRKETPSVTAVKESSSSRPLLRVLWSRTHPRTTFHPSLLQKSTVVIRDRRTPGGPRPGPEDPGRLFVHPLHWTLRQREPLESRTTLGVGLLETGVPERSSVFYPSDSGSPPFPVGSECPLSPQKLGTRYRDGDCSGPDGGK